MAEKDVRLRFLVEAVNRSGAVLDKTARDLQQIGRAAQQLGTKTQQAANKGATALNKFQRAAKRLEGSFKSMQAAGDKMTGLGTQMAFVGAGIAAAAIVPIKAAASFERAMSKVKAIASPTAAEFENLTKKAKDLGRTTKFTAKEAAEGMKFLAMTGFSANQVIATIGPSLLLAAAGGLELGEAADIASNVLKQFGLEVEDLIHVTDVLANTAASSNVSVRQLAQSLSLAGPIAAVAGISLDKTAAIIGVLGDAGIHSTRAGTAMRGMIAALAKMTPKAQRAFKSLGAEVIRLDNGSVDLIATLESLHKAGMKEAEAFAIFSRMAAPAALIVGQNVARIRELDEANIKAIGSTERMAKVMEDNLGGAMILLKSAVEAFLEALGAPLLKPIRTLVDAIAKVVRGMADWAEHNPKLVGTLVAVIGTLGSVLAILGLILIPLGLTIKLVGLLGPVLLSTAVKAGAAAGGLTLMGGAADVASMKFLRLTAVMKTSLASILLLVTTLVLALRAWNEFMGAIEASDETQKTMKRTAAMNALMAAKVRKFNRETGLQAETIGEVNAMMKAYNVVLDKSTNTFIRMTKAEKEAWLFAKKFGDEAKIGFAASKATTGAFEESGKAKEAAAKIALETSRMRIALMDDEVAKLRATMKMEIDIFNESNDAKIVSARIRANRIAAIEDTFASQIEAIEQRKADAEKVANDQRLTQQAAFAEETRLMKLDLIGDPMERLEAELSFELTRLQEQFEQKLVDEQAFEERKSAIEDTFRNRKVILEQQAADATAAVWRYSANALENIFSDLYELSGRKVKAFFYLQRAVAVAQAIQDTMLAVGKVAGQTGIFGIPLQALVFAQGMARVALISAQTIRGFAEGGQVSGKRGKDSIIARLTNDEFVMQVAAVKHYGLNVMEAMNRRALDITATVPQMVVHRPKTPHYQEGGVVAPTEGLEDERPTVETTIVNITDPREIDAFLASSRGQNAVVNLISSNAARVRRVLR